MIFPALTDPNLAFLLLLAGALALYWEMHAPGAVFPGLLGVLLICAGAFGLFEDAPTWYGSVLILVAILLLGVELKFYSHGVSGIAGAILLFFGAAILLQGPRKISPILAVAVSCALCLIVAFLGYLGMRARKSEQLTGLQRLVGEFGVSRTDISEKGTVLVRGEYWQARSDHAIPSGQRVLIQRVQGIVLYVKEA